MVVTKPRIPDFDDRVNFVVNQLVDPCDAPISVCASLMLPALGDAVIAWYTVDLKDIVTAMVRPKSIFGRGRSAFHLTSGERGKRGPGGNYFDDVKDFDPNDFIGKNLPGGNELNERIPGPWETRFWLLEGLAEVAGFWWMVYDLTSSFAYRWASAVSETAYCHARDDASFVGKVPHSIGLGIFGWDTQVWGVPVKERNIVFYNGFGIMQETGFGVASFSCLATPIGTSTDSWVEFRISGNGGPSGYHEDFRHFDTPGGEPAAAQVSINIEPGMTVICQMRCNGVGFFYDNMVFAAHARA